MSFLVTGSEGFIGKRIRGGMGFNGDVADFNAVYAQALSKSGIVHLAAKSNARRCDDDPLGCIRANIIGILNVLEAAMFLKIWVIFVSTYAVRDPSLYGMTKLVGEELCRIYQAKGLKVKIIRLPIVYGPGDRLGKVVTRTIREVKNGRTPISKTNETLRFAYVDDIAKAIEREVAVIGGKWGRPAKFRDLVAGIKECL